MKTVLKRTEDYNFYNYFSGEDAHERGIFVGGNRALISINEDLIAEVEQNFVDLAEKLDRDEPATDAEVIEAVRNQFAVELTDEEAMELYHICDKRFYGKVSELYDYYAEALSVIKKTKYISTLLRGCSQGDWIFCVCPEETDTDYISALLFGLGDEYEITQGDATWWDFCPEHDADKVKQWAAENFDCDVSEVSLLVPRKRVVIDYEEI